MSRSKPEIKIINYKEKLFTDGKSPAVRVKLVVPESCAKDILRKMSGFPFARAISSKDPFKDPKYTGPDEVVLKIYFKCANPKWGKMGLELQVNGLADDYTLINESPAPKKAARAR